MLPYLDTHNFVLVNLYFSTIARVDYSHTLMQLQSLVVKYVKITG